MLKKESLNLCDIHNNKECPYFKPKKDKQKDCFECKYDYYDDSNIHCQNKTLNKAAEMQDLIDSIETINKWNKMPFDEFIKLYESFFNVKLHKYDKQDYKLRGLTNVQFVKFMQGV